MQETCTPWLLLYFLTLNHPLHNYAQCDNYNESQREPTIQNHVEYGHFQKKISHNIWGSTYTLSSTFMSISSNQICFNQLDVYKMTLEV